MPEVRSKWNFNFQLKYTVSLFVNSLQTTFSVTNLDSSPFDFNVLCHTYFSVPDISKVKITGLEDATYTDKTSAGKRVVQAGPIQGVNHEYDYVYENVTSSEIKIDFHAKDFAPLSIQRENMPDIVVWNPWIQKAKEFSDFGDKEYNDMVCVEVGNVSKFLKIGVGETFSGTQRIQILPSEATL